jgi:hypothetical protein
MKTATYAISFIIGTLALSQTAFAASPATTRYSTAPAITEISTTSAQVSVPTFVLSNMTEKARTYFQYIQKDLVCIAIYPTPAACLPKKTQVGQTNVKLTDLKPNTTYTVVYKRDNSIYCITTPCPTNEFESASSEFTTKASSSPSASSTVRITKNLFIGSRGAQVTALQQLLIEQGYMKGSATGYFGGLTLQAVRHYQKDHRITGTGFVGALTRKALLATTTPSSTDSAETFEGTITAYSTNCFADGECSITVDGKKVVTTIGWSQQTVGTVTGIPDFGSVSTKVGSHAKVYAKKTADGYTLYGSSSYYVQVY